MNKELERQCREKMREVSDENIAWLMHSIYLDFPIDGPYLSDTRSHGGENLCKDHKNRKLFKQIFLGAYGPAGIVYSIQGSPPKGIIYVSGNGVIFEALFRKSAKPVILNKYEDRNYSVKKQLCRYFLSCFEVECIDWRENKK